MAFDLLANGIGAQLPILRPLLFAAQPRQLCQSPECRKDVTLHLDQRDRPFRNAAVGMEDGIEAVLPSLVGKAGFRGALIGKKPCRTARCLDPLGGGAQRWPKPIDESRV